MRLCGSGSSTTTNARKRPNSEYSVTDYKYIYTTYIRQISVFADICYNSRSMRNEPVKKITVPEGSSLAKLLIEAGSRPILLEKNGKLYRLERMEKEGKGLSPEEVTRSREGILKAAGSWKGRTPRRLKRISRIAATLPIVHL
jgi:hypothetical protein